MICLDSITSKTERQTVTDVIVATDKEIIPITLEQMNRFAGNMLQLEKNDGEKILVMSTQAYQSLTEEQISHLKRYNNILYADLTTIETNGGGSARCMIAEVFLQNRS